MFNLYINTKFISFVTLLLKVIFNKYIIDFVIILLFFNLSCASIFFGINNLYFYKGF